MGNKLIKVEGIDRWLFWCPACKEHHFFQTEKTSDVPHEWAWDRSELKPTIAPSINLSSKDAKGKVHRCQFFIHEGIIKYLQDCTHDLKGKDVPMVDIDSI